jgi:hypothetical protein
VHDGLQCSGGKLSNHLRPSYPAGRRSRGDELTHHHQPDSKHHVQLELRHDAARVPDELRASIAFTVKIFSSRPVVAKRFS